MTSEQLSRRKLLAAVTAASSATTAGCVTKSLLGEKDGVVKSPGQTKVGDPLRVRLADFEPNTSVTLTIAATDARGHSYRGSWSLQTGSHGGDTFSSAALPDNAPKTAWYGSGHGFQAAERQAVEMVLHRLSAERFFASPPNFVVDGQSAIELDLQANPGLLDQPVAGSTQSRVYVDPEISRRPVRASGLVGWLYEPAGSGPYPGVITLHGALAAVPHRLSKLLATHGYATLALKYFDASGLPESLEAIEIEYFDRAIEWLTGRANVRDGGIGLVGISRGVEAALLTAAGYDGPATVVGYSGGGAVRHGVTGVPPTAFVSRPAWTRNGTPVAPTGAIEAVFDAVDEASQDRCTVESLPGAVRERVSEAVLERVLVRVEEIDGPVLLLAGGDDHRWPSVPTSALTISRLRRRAHPHPYGLRVYCNAGHIFGVPYADYTGPPTSDKNGGTPKANARAAADSWPLVLDYLDPGFQ